LDGRLSENGSSAVILIPESSEAFPAQTTPKANKPSSPTAIKLQRLKIKTCDRVGSNRVERCVFKGREQHLIERGVKGALLKHI
jgi:hypothetical protein